MPAVNGVIVKRHPNTRDIAKREFVEGMDPLDILLPWEQKAAEIYFAMSGNPHLRAGAGVKTDAFLTALRQQCYVKPDNTTYLYLMGNPAWRAYVKQLKDHTREAILAKMSKDAVEVYDDYKWSRTAAREASDYKETRIAAGDHLDRLNVTLKKEAPVVTAIQIVLKSTHFTPENLLADSPDIEAEAIEPGDPTGETA